MPTAVAERRPDKAFTPHPAILCSRRGQQMPRGLELLIAQTILQGFDAQYGRFLEVTSGRSSVSSKPTGMLSSRR
ncbi:hypothetical protein ACLK2D_21185 [Escherichia coli]